MKPMLALAHAPADAARAAEIALALATYGYEVEIARRPGAGRKLVVLWSKAGARCAPLRAAARRAVKAGGVAIVRLDGAKAPASLGGAHALRLPRGVGAAALWRRALEDAAPLAAPTSPAPGSRAAGVGAALLMALATGAALYVSDAAFAHRLNTLAGAAQAHAAEWMGALTTKARGDRSV